MRLTIAALVLMIASPIMAADTAKALIGGWYAANEECRGEPGGTPRSDTGCAAREAISNELTTLGLCEGAGPESRWRLCRG